MTEENYGSVWTIDYCYLLSKTNLSTENEMNKTTYWINLRPIYSGENSSKGSKIDYHLYLLQEVKAKYFLKLYAEEGKKINSFLTKYRVKLRRKIIKPMKWFIITSMKYGVLTWQIFQIIEFQLTKDLDIYSL